ncbi:MAG: hypothetical protein GY845_22855 [Planctomycetes bacterium]|nr:hypothetical protein [Planctomycetota bacterium]
MIKQLKHWNDVSEGEELPTYERLLNRTAVIAMGFAARDLLPPVHVDYEAAQEAGLKDTNVNIIATGGLIEKYLTSWSGPITKLRKLRYQIGVSVYPGDTLIHTGRVMKKYKEKEKYLLDMEFNLAVAAGSHAWGTATVELPNKG